MHLTPALPTVTRAMHEAQQGHRGAVIWLTGLSGAGKSTLAQAVQAALHAQGCRSFVLDGDNVRLGLCRDLSFSASDRHENIRRVGEVAKLFMEAGVIALAAFISPFEADRQAVRALLPADDFIEVYCSASVAVCEARDVKGLYQKARQGAIADFTGVSAPYEAPTQPSLVIDSAHSSVDQAVAQVLGLLRQRGIIRA